MIRPYVQSEGLKLCTSQLPWYIYPFNHPIFQYFNSHSSLWGTQFTTEPAPKFRHASYRSTLGPKFKERHCNIPPAR